MVSKGFGGTLQSVQLPDAIQLICMSGRTAALTVSVRQNRGVLFFEKGELIHAVYNDLKGDEAFYRIIGWVGGEFALAALSPDHERTIFESWEGMLLEAARRNDEANIPIETEADSSAEEEPKDEIVDLTADPGSAAEVQADDSVDDSEARGDIFDFSQLETASEESTESESDGGEETSDDLSFIDETDSEKVGDFGWESAKQDDDQKEEQSSEESDSVTEMFNSFDKLESGISSFRSQDETEVAEKVLGDDLTEASPFEEFDQEDDSVEEETQDSDDVQPDSDDEETVETEMEGELEVEDDQDESEEESVQESDEVQSESEEEDTVETEKEDVSEAEDEGEATEELPETEELEEQPEEEDVSEVIVEEESDELEVEAEPEVVTEEKSEEPLVEESDDTPTTETVSEEADIASEVEEACVSEDSISKSLDNIVKSYMQTWPADQTQIRFDAITSDLLPESIRNHFLCRFLQVAMNVIHLDDMPFDFTSEELNKEIRNMYQVLRDNWMITRDYYHQVLYDANYFDLTRSVDPARAILFDRTENEVDQLLPFMKALIQNKLIGDQYEELWNDIRIHEESVIHPRKIENFIRALLDRKSVSDAYKAVRVAMQRLLDLAGIGADIPQDSIGISLILTMLESRGLVNVADFVRDEQKTGKQKLTIVEMDDVMERYQQHAKNIPSRRIRSGLSGGQTPSEQQDVIFSLKRESKQ